MGRPRSVPWAEQSYKSFHTILARERGSAKEYWCDSCDSRAQDWAYLWDEPDPCRLEVDGQVWSHDPGRYIPMCKKCHMQYDHSIPITHCPYGHAYTEENTCWSGTARKRHCRTCLRERANTKRKATHDFDSLNHGVVSTYTGYGCRCLACANAWRRYHGRPEKEKSE